MDQTAKAQKKLAGNALSGMIATIIYMVSRLLLTPFILHYISLAEFGLWSLCFIILSYAGMGGFGVNSTYIRYAARYLAEGREKDISKLLSTGIAYMLSFSILFCTGLYLIMPFILERFHIDKTQQELATTIFLGTAAVFGLELTLGGLRFIINGMHEFAREKIVTTAAGLAEIVAMIAFLYFGAGIKGLLYAFAFKLVLETASCWTIARSLLPSLRISWKLVSREHFRLFLGFGGKVQVLGILGIFLTVLDRMFITAISGLAAGGMFEIGRKFPSSAGGISTSAFGPFLSTAAHLEGNWTGNRTNPVSERITTYLHIALTAAALAIVPIVFLPQVQHWLPISTIPLAVVVSVAAIFLFFLLHQKIRNDNQLDSKELKELYLNGIRFTNMISSTLFFFLIAIAHPLIDAWVGKDYAAAADVMIFLSIAYPIQLGTGPVTMIFRGINRNGRELEYMLIQLILMVIWIPSATMEWGLTGAAASIALSSIVSTSYFYWRSNATFLIRFREFIPHTIFPVFVPVVPALLVFAVTCLFPVSGRVPLILEVLLCGCGYVLLALALFWAMVLDTEEKKKALELLPFAKQRNPLC
ncbi:MAG: polysaccharide biosynthesis protein [Chlorobiaceae bacterium]|nr:polysaccharide biosynthesis protein [Chlorobiaceae bacterium]NTV60842.1 polysaccharide biosynthesis protein [Chlorobiaceae bacterium]